METELPDLGQCDCCGDEPGVGVAAVPGVPISIVWGRKCLERPTIGPLWIVDFQVAQCCRPDDPKWDDVAEWFREGLTYKDGEYVRVDSLTLEVRDCPGDPKHGHDYCGCWKGKIVGVEGGERKEEQQ